MDASDPSQESSRIAAEILPFALWAASALDLTVTANGDGSYTLLVPGEDCHVFDNVERVVFSATREMGESAANHADNAVLLEQLTPDCRLLKYLVGRLTDKGPLHVVPTLQPVGVHELTPHLFAPYDVDSGRVQLAGCRLEDRPFVKLTCLVRNVSGGAGQLAELIFADDGQIADETLVADLGLSQLRPLPHAPVPTEKLNLDGLLGTSRQQTAAHWPSGKVEILAAVLVWCKFARVKLSFVIGDESAHVEFSGWARRIVNGQTRPPPYRCAETGTESYRLAADEDGKIGAADDIAACEKTGRRVLVTELTTCAATGQRLLTSLTEKCPVSGTRVAQTALVSCSMCRQSVSPSTVRAGKCTACRSTKAVSQTDRPLNRLLERYPGLRNWKRWKISETDIVYVLVGSTVFRRLLVVVAKDTLEPLRVATAGWLGSGWSDVPGPAQDELLR